MSVLLVKDSFEDENVNPAIWKNRQIEPHQIAFSADAPHSDRAIVITTASRDGGTSCGSAPCQRAELRLHGNLRPVYGEEVYHGFSFKMSGDIQPFGSNRTVIGQWKAPGDDSPFLAQRFDNGVFHITVQDGPNRITVASAKGDPDALDEFQTLVETTSADPSLGPDVLRSEKARADLRAFQRYVTPSENSTMPATVVAQAQNAADSTSAHLDARLEALLDEFSFIQDLDAYAVRPKFEIERHGPKMLPDPREDWVDMICRIKGGRTDNQYGPNHQGEIDIWANGELIAEVRGNVGYRLPEPPESKTMYFKFGTYRNRLPNTILFHFDHFRQGATLADVT